MNNSVAKDVIGGMTSWFVGVVEDRIDPMKVGRVRVRIFGDHTSDKTLIPTQSLPWAQVMTPITSASCAGIGDSATGIVQGSWVVGFYMDGENKQQPLILGTIPGIPTPANPDEGFHDPTGVNPVRVEDTDTPYCATDAYEWHESYISKVDLRQEKVELAVPPRVSTVAVDQPDSYYERPTWDSPLVHSGEAPEYPYNKVKETERGHVFEIDDTPGNERISQFHRMGTNYEIQADGSKTVTVVGDQYTVIFRSNNMYVKGNMNVTVDGNFRHLVKGNYHLEVNGNKTEYIRGSRQTKIGQNENIEVSQGLSSNVTENYMQRVGGDETRMVVGLRSTSIGTTEDLTVGSNMGVVVLGKTDVFSSNDYSLTTTGLLNVTASGNITVETPSNKIENVDGNVTETFGGNQTTQITGNLDVDAARIDLN